ncbi:MAG: AAA family ATPase [Bacteroidales bacterium]|nr:AAA family ATPase [Bacteroidales bacterium]
MDFTDENIQSLFGFEDAESEPIDRLREYYFKKDTFGRVEADLPIRILVGHKGTGKSALFKVAISEEREKGNLPILIKPDDIAELGKSDENFLLRIRQWKYGLIKIIGSKVLNEFGLFSDSTSGKLGQFGVKIISFISESIASISETVNLQPSQKLLIDNFLKSKKIIVYIDDLDRGWEGNKDDINRISALLNAIRDMSNDNQGLIFKISLRSDVFYLVRTSDESTDKIEGSVVWFKWTNHEILVMLIKRIMTFFGEKPDEAQLMNTPQRHLSFHLDKVFESKFLGKGKWDNVPIYRILMSLTRKRPRDLVKLCSLAAQQAHLGGSFLIRTSHFQAIFEEYSQGRIQDTINEYKSELPQIEKLLFGMKPTKKQRLTSDSYIYNSPELHLKINNLKQQVNFSFSNGRDATAKDLAQFLYKINFLTARKTLEDGTIQRKYFEENRYLSSTFVDFGYEWEVHPAFRWALQPDNIDDIFYNLALSSDD